MVFQVYYTLETDFLRDSQVEEDVLLKYQSNIPTKRHLDSPWDGVPEASRKIPSGFSILRVVQLRYAHALGRFDWQSLPVSAREAVLERPSSYSPSILELFPDFVSWTFEFWPLMPDG
jgi:hypothetical protein